MKKRVKRIVRDRMPHILLFVLIDMFALLISSMFSVWLRFDFGFVPDPYLVNAYQYFIIDFLIILIVFLIFKLYTSVWRYASVLELINIISACSLSELIMAIYKIKFDILMPRSYFIIQLFLLIALTCISRFGYRVFRAILIRLENTKKTTNTMLIGAGDAGRIIIDEVRMNKNNQDVRISCVIDDKTVKDIEKKAIEYDIKDIIIAIPSAPKEKISKIVTECQKTKANIKILPSIYSSLSGTAKTGVINKVRPLSYEDFLGRDQIVVNDQEISDNLENKVVLVTGGGGSIGSELCRQIAAANPKTLIIFDIYENNAYEIQQELFRTHPELDLHTIIGSVRDIDRLEKVYKEFEIDQVYHAAAHKHVPLMEVSPNEAIKNNCLGTLNVAKLCDKYKVKKMVLISTDKAVRPTNVMGASKRICEMIVQTYDKLSKDTDYVAVRFGNVLGSNGSVIPLFLKQIDEGGPVTVTHKEMTRFFMTIPEAVSLVLQAGCYAKGGEIFVLDMGKPVKIYDLAQKLIRYKGYEPDIDIPIKITGLRPGEKMYEEILMDEEGLQETPNKLIHIGKPIKISKTFMEDLDGLIKAAYKNKDDIKDKVAKIVTTYTIDKERVGK